ncbi:unnamed protein product [Miscanthus lutarioriparius]|uniref:folate gamma-glutamyl hydrolase n=1 Tax=Miscanthus lutarioriparius TaxID=422564 RepID=A0A811RX57_9POAL|nr:unnamed protein product [Miscanthus lutarioriparius]
MDSRRCPHLLLPLLFLAALLAPPPSEATAAPAGVIRLRTSGKAGAAACAAPPPDPAVYDRPVIGIVSHPGDGAGGRISNTTVTSYIAASYVKFIEAGGARVIPIIYNEPEEHLLERLSLVNGVLFTGGSAKRGLYFETIKKVFQYVLDKNDAGEQFPLFAQCLGFELVGMIVSLTLTSSRKSAPAVLSCNSINTAPTFLWAGLNALILADPCMAGGSDSITEQPNLVPNSGPLTCLLFIWVKYGISPRRLQENDALSSFFKILTTSPDENGKVYVSTVQAHKYTITCTQWHPEKAIFEWRNPVIPHSEDAVQVLTMLVSYL